MRMRIAALLLVLAAGCATPARRIASHPELFASFPPEVQAKVKEGMIDVGYSQDMVFIALGRPDRVFERSTAEGRSEIWVYTDVIYTTRFDPAESAYWQRTRRGHPQLVRDYAWIDVRQRSEFEILRVEFRDGKATAVERRR